MNRFTWKPSDITITKAKDENSYNPYEISTELNGGPGSGNHGHSGRPGVVGGSSSRGFTESATKPTAYQAFYAYQDYAYQDINNYLRIKAMQKSGKTLDKFDKRDIDAIESDPERLQNIKDNIEVMDKTFKDEGRNGGYGYRIDNGIAVDLFADTKIGSYIKDLQSKGNLPSNHDEWYGSKSEYATKLNDLVKRELVGYKYKYNSYVSTDSERSSAVDRFASGNGKMDSVGFESYVSISSSRAKTIRVNDITKMDTLGGQENPENEVLFDRGNKFEIYNAEITLTSADGYSGVRGQGFQLSLYMKDATTKNTTENGGPGSGNHGHSGRPGVVGGSSSYGLNESTYKFINEVPVTITGENYRAKALFNELGYTGKPKLVDEIAKNETPLYRGIIEEDGNTFKESFIKGDFFVGDGNVGPGAYFTEDSRLAESFSGNGILIKASLQKDAKGIGIGELKAEMKSLRDSGLTDASTNGYFDGFMFAHTEPGVFAALKGYDYIDVPSTPTYGPQTVILNRTKLNVEKSHVDVRNSASKIKNYSPSQPRDSIGRFSSGPGGSKSITSSSESKQIEKLKSVEKNIRNNDYETFVAVSPSGKVLLNKKGTKSEVLISKQEIEDMSRANNVIFTHNHPSSNSFSLNDMHMGMSINAKEIRIVSKKYTYSLKPPKISMSLVGPRDNHWPNPENLNNIMKEQESINYDKLVPKVQSGEISTETAWLTHTHNVIKSTAKTFEMEYSRVEIK